jgi:hypothetical protein
MYLDATHDDEAKARKVMVQRLSEYKGRISVTPVEGRRTEGRRERVVDEGAKNVNEGLAVDRPCGE